MLCVGRQLAYCVLYCTLLPGFDLSKKAVGGPSAPLPSLFPSPSLFLPSDPQTKIFSHQCGVIFNQWGLNPPAPRQIEPCLLPCSTVLFSAVNVYVFYQQIYDELMMMMTRFQLTV